MLVIDIFRFSENAISALFPLLNGKMKGTNSKASAHRSFLFQHQNYPRRNASASDSESGKTGDRRGNTLLNLNGKSVTGHAPTLSGALSIPLNNATLDISSSDTAPADMRETSTLNLPGLTALLTRWLKNA